MFKEKQDFPFIKNLENNWQVIQQELLAIDHKRFLAWPEKHLYEKGWDIFGLIAFGVRIEGNCSICPTSAQLVSQIPGIVTAGFSSLQPGTHIAAHTGYPDGVLRCHLGLIGCDRCRLRVGDQIRSWQEGQCIVFDDTTEHEVWHEGDRTRVVLLLDFRYPLVEKGETSKNWWQKLLGQ